jgi:hypothetical protein
MSLRTAGYRYPLVSHIVCMIFIMISSFSYAVEDQDSTKKKLVADATISINSNGIASIPAFSLGQPAAMATIKLKKGRFSYDPQLAYGLNMKPWYIDNWFHFEIIDRTAFSLVTGYNVSSFFSDYETEDDVFFQSQRYIGVELSGIYNITEKKYLALTYKYDKGKDKGTIRGHFISFAGEWTGISVGQYLLLSSNLQLFYIDYQGKNDGFFISPVISFSVKEQPFSIILSGYPGPGK